MNIVGARSPRPVNESFHWAIGRGNPEETPQQKPPTLHSYKIYGYEKEIVLNRYNVYYGSGTVRSRICTIMGLAGLMERR